MCEEATQNRLPSRPRINRKTDPATANGTGSDPDHDPGTGPTPRAGPGPDRVTGRPFGGDRSLAVLPFVRDTAAFGRATRSVDAAAGAAPRPTADDAVVDPGTETGDDDRPRDRDVARRILRRGVVAAEDEIARAAAAVVEVGAVAGEVVVAPTAVAVRRNVPRNLDLEVLLRRPNRPLPELIKENIH